MQKYKSETKKIILELKHISKKFNKDIALNDINLKMYSGEFISILGPSGCGKTTMLRIISGLEKPDYGQIIINDQISNHVSAAKRKINTIFQDYSLFPHMNVFNNISFGLKIEKVPEDEIKRKVNDIVKKIQISHLLYKSPHQLSGGEKQRVAIARAIVKKPQILLLDEPFSALDKTLREKIQIELKEIQKIFKVTIIFVTHDQEEALSISNRIIVMNKSKIAQIGTPETIHKKPHNIFVANFIGTMNTLNAKIIKINNKKVYILIENVMKYCIIINNIKNYAVQDLLIILIESKNIKITTRVRNKDNKLYGVIKYVSYKGYILEYKVEINKNKMIKISEIHRNNEKQYQIGTKVMISWNKSFTIHKNDQ